jgi:hypothetical protein
VSQPPPCDQDVFKNGTPIFCATTGPTGGCHLFEAWIVKIREASKQQVDWHYSGGRAQVLYIGDADAIRTAVEAEPLPKDCEILGWFNPGEGLYRANHE